MPPERLLAPWHEVGQQANQAQRGFFDASDWPIDGGEMGARIRSFDWSETPLGPLDSWPQSLRTVVDLMLCSAQPVYIAWGAQRISLHNDAYIPILGDKHPGALGLPFRTLWREVWDEYRPHLEAAMAGTAQHWQDQPVQLAGRAGRPVSWFTFSWTPIRSETGTIAGLFCHAVETTDRVLAEHDLVQSMDEGFAILEVEFAADGTPSDWRHVRTNSAFEAQSGLKDAVGRRIRDMVPGIEPHWLERIGRVACTGEANRFVAQVAGLAKWFEVYAFRYGGRGDSSVGVLFRDVTARHDLEQDFRRNQEKQEEDSRRKDEFLAMLAHELRNPLAPISAAAALLQMTGVDAARVKGASAIISRQVRHLTGLVDDLLDVSRVTRGHVTLQRSTLDARRIVAEAVEQVRPLIDARHHTLLVRTCAAPAMVDADSTRLVQVFVNLLTNAARYTPPSGHIFLTVESDAEVRIAVTDDGQGMSRELLERCFDLFVQAERSSDRRQGGLGIGLALVKSLVELHGGRVMAESSGPGMGSRFTLTLQRVASPIEAPAPEVTDSAPAMRERRKVLILDDNHDAARTLGMLLESIGHEVMLEFHPHDALERIGKDAPDVCLVDIGLPEMDGYELARAVRESGADIILIAVTGYGRAEDLEKALDAGFDHHLLKPVDVSRLVELLNEHPRSLALDGGG